jgi:hypothetical protein
LTTRRKFMERALAGAAVLLPFARFKAAAQDEVNPEAEYEEIFKKKTAEAIENKYAARPIGEVMGAIGLSFEGAPYVAHSLEVPGPEHLVVNLRAFDCTTFVESVLALSRCVRQGQTEYEDFRAQLQELRYRDGHIDGYPSRLHYFTDWVQDNAARGHVRDVTRSLGGSRDERPINFMTTHLSSYPQLAQASFVRQIRSVEERLSLSDHFMLSKDKVDAAAAHLQTGDIIGITTTIEGIDVSHLGLVLRSGGKAKFLHAPLSGGVVTLTAGTLGEYLAKNSKHTGIIVARPSEP